MLRKWGMLFSLIAIFALAGLIVLLATAKPSAPTVIIWLTVGAYLGALGLGLLAVHSSREYKRQMRERLAIGK